MINILQSVLKEKMIAFLYEEGIDDQHGEDQQRTFTAWIGDCLSSIIRGLWTMQPHYLRAKNRVATSNSKRNILNMYIDTLLSFKHDLKTHLYKETLGNLHPQS